LPRRFAGDPTYLFLGNLQYPANAYSLSLFMREAMPGLVRTQPRTKLIVLGRGANADLMKQSRSWDGHIQFLDFVEDLAPLMSTAAAMVVPLIYGSGLKMKVLDALYYGLPVVSTRHGIDGVPATAGRECFIEDDVAAFVNPLTQLLDVGLNRRMSHCAQNLYAEQFAPEIVWNEYEAIFGTSKVRIAPLQRQQHAR
jgi:glycosyltransferase involved in cell wall biosynthesis